MGNENNSFLKFYGEHLISPVKQDISDINLHYRRRQKLYRQLGIPTLVFRNADILEVGPGSGYNTLAFFNWGIKHADLIEPNSTGIKEMEALFNGQGVNVDLYYAYECTLEGYNTDKQYDIVIAEGFLPHLENKKELIDIIKELVKPGGLVSVTCVDKVGLFVEYIKRVVGHALIKDVESYDDKVEALTEIFEEQLGGLRGSSRSANNWVQDQLLNPSIINGNYLSIKEAIFYFGKEFEVQGTSPHIFTDYSWYKDVWSEDTENYNRQFEDKNISFILSGMEEKVICKSNRIELEKAITIIREQIVEFEDNHKDSNLKIITREVTRIKEILFGLDRKLDLLMKEITQIMLTLTSGGSVQLKDYPIFIGAFGRAQQYVSFVKKSYDT